MAAVPEARVPLFAADVQSREVVASGAGLPGEAVLLAEAVVSAAEPAVSAAASAADIPEPRAARDIRVAFPASIRFSAAVVLVDIPERPRSAASPSGECSASFASSVAVVRSQFARSTSGARANRDLCKMPSNGGLHRNKSLEHLDK